MEAVLRRRADILLAFEFSCIMNSSIGCWARKLKLTSMEPGFGDETPLIIVKFMLPLGEVESMVGDLVWRMSAELWLMLVRLPRLDTG